MSTTDLAAWLLERIAEDELFWDLVEESKQAHPDRIRRYRAECEAKRQIVETVLAVDDGTAPPTTLILGDDLLTFLAQPYADRPGWREEWTL